MTTMTEANRSAVIRRALAMADLDAVRMALYHNTRDPMLAQLPRASKLDSRQRETLLAKAAEWLEENAGPLNLPEPSEADLRLLLEMATKETLGELEFQARRDQPAFKDYPFFVQWDDYAPNIPEDFSVVIVGSGFSGLSMALQCQLLGVNYVLLDRRPEPGGVWSINRYPDIRVDTISITYEFAFEKDYRWKEYFGRGEEVRAYLGLITEKYGIREHTLYNHTLRSAKFDETQDRWTLEVDTPDGPKVFNPRIFVTAMGVFANPILPDFVGKESFSEVIVHPSRWPEDLSLEGKRVAIIGNGSTGIQMLGTVARQAAQTFVFQRTPQWIMPRDRYGEAMEPEVHWLMDNFPGYWNWYRYIAGAALFDTHSLVCTDPEWQRDGGQVNAGSDAMRKELLSYIERETGGRKDLIERLVPDYAPFSRRPVVDNGWYRALTRDDVELVTDQIDHFCPEGIHTVDGTVHEVDVIVSATGFDVVKYLLPARIRGVDNKDLHDFWDEGDGPRAYIGTLVPHFPNLFMIYGPNSQPVSSGPSQVTWSMIWASYIGRCLKRMLTDDMTRLEVTASAYEAYNHRLDEEASKLVSMTKGGAMEKNYYVNQEHARLQVNAPWYGPVFQKMFREVDWDALTMSAEPSTPNTETTHQN